MRIQSSALLPTLTVSLTFALTLHSNPDVLPLFVKAVLAPQTLGAPTNLIVFMMTKQTCASAAHAHCCSFTLGPQLASTHTHITARRPVSSSGGLKDKRLWLRRATRPGTLTSSPSAHTACPRRCSPCRRCTTSAPSTTRSCCRTGRSSSWAARCKTSSALCRCLALNASPARQHLIANLLVC